MADLPRLPALLADPLLAAIAARKRNGLLLLDYDGTLAPFQARRDLARPYPGVIERLGRLPASGPGRFAVVSGRVASEVAAFLHPAIPAAIWGRHGAERLLPGGEAQLQALPPVWEEALRRAGDLAAAAAPPQALEWKTVSLALHWRGMATAAQQRLARRVRPQWEALAQATGLAVLPFDGGLELRPPDWHKGRAVRRIQHEDPGATLVYLGDDQTDEDAFRAVRTSGLGVLVRADRRPTSARYRIEPPGELLRFLDHWANAHAGGSRGPRN